MTTTTEKVKNLQQRLAYLLKQEVDAKANAKAADEDVERVLAEHAPDTLKRQQAAKDALKEARKERKALRKKAYTLLDFAEDFEDVDGFSLYNEFTVTVSDRTALFVTALEYFPHWLTVDMTAVERHIRGVTGEPDETGRYELPTQMRALLPDGLLSVYDRRAWKISDSTLRELAPDNEPDADAPGLSESDYIPF